MLHPDPSKRITAEQAAQTFTILSAASSLNTTCVTGSLTPNSPVEPLFSPQTTTRAEPDTQNNPLRPPSFTTHTTDSSLQQEDDPLPGGQGCCVIA